MCSRRVMSCCCCRAEEEFCLVGPMEQAYHFLLILLGRAGIHDMSPVVVDEDRLIFQYILWNCVEMMQVDLFGGWLWKILVQLLVSWLFLIFCMGSRGG